MVHDDPFRPGLHRPDVVQELEPIRMTGEAVDRLDIHLDGQGERLPAIRQGDLARLPLDPSAQRAFRLEPDEDERVQWVVRPAFEVLEDRTAGHHARGRQDDARLDVIDDVRAHVRRLDPLESRREERILAGLEDLRPELAVQILRIRGVDRGRFPDHAVQVDRHLRDLVVPDRVLEDEHDLLGPPDREDGHQDLPAAGQDAAQDLLQLLSRLMAGRLDVVVSAVRRLEDERLQPRELVDGRVEKPRLLELDVSRHRDVVQPVPDVEVCDAGAEDVARVLEGEPDVRGDVRGLAVLQRDRVRHRLSDVARFVRGLAGLAHRDLDEVELEERHQIARGRGRVDRAFVSVLEQRRHQSGMVQVRVGDDDRIDRAERSDLRGVQVRRAVVFRDQHTAIDEDLRLPRAQQGRGPTDLTESSERRDPDVVLSRRHLAGKSPADLLQERLTFIVDRPKILTDLLDGLRGNRRRPDDFRGPPDLFLDLVEDRAVAANDHSRGEGLDRHLARLRLEVDPGDLRFRGDHLADDLLRFLGSREQGRIRPDDDPAPQLLRDLSHEVVRLCEDLHVLRVDHDRGAFEVDLRDFHVVRYHFLHDASRVVQNVLDGHRTSLWPEVASDSGQFHTRFALLDFFVVEHLEAVFRNEGHIDPFAGDRVAFHGGGHGADREVRPLFERP